MRKIAKATAAVLIGLASLGSAGAALADTSIQGSNSCDDCEVETGQSNSGNASASFTGQSGSGLGVSNVQEGDNETELSQNADASSGDGVTGQAIGSAGQGDTDIVASNSCTDCKVTTGDANAGNAQASFVGQLALGLGVANFQVGDNESDLEQNASSSTGDGVTGQVIGVI